MRLWPFRSMPASEIAQIVERWFARNGYTNGPLLPDGWHGGRRFENACLLDSVQSVGDHTLLINLSEGLVLTIEGPGRVCEGRNRLVFRGYTRAELRWRSYGGGPHAQVYEQVYRSGRIVFSILKGSEGTA